jgi:predicted HD superfamily hydrolase involved in NAD metabolism
LHFATLAARVRQHLGQHHRYAHVVRTARAAERLAYKHAVSTPKARVAGMLHDLARLYTAARLIDECEMRQMPIDDFAREHPIVLHAPLSARLAEESFGVHDAEVLSAIAKHTVADAEMSALDCVLYLADGLEPGRDFPDRAQLWALAEQDLAAAMKAMIASSMRYLNKKGLPVAPETAAAARAFGLKEEEVSPSLI